MKLDPVASGRRRGVWKTLSLVKLLLLQPGGASAGTPAERLLAPELLEASGPLVIAHRGFSARGPENTLPAFRLALAAGADLVELDYAHSKDGVPMVIHDRTLDRTTDATNRWGGAKIAVAATTAAEIATLDAGSWFDTRFGGTTVPTLAGALEAIQPAGTTLIERKGGEPETLVRMLREQGCIATVVVQSFDWDFVQAAHALAPELVLGALGPPSTWKGRRLEEAEKALKPAFIEEIADLGARLVVWNRQVDRPAIAAARQRGLGVWVYTINDPSEAEALVRLGVQGIITDDPTAIRARLRPQADESGAAASVRAIPTPLPHHPGNIHLEGEIVTAQIPRDLPAEAARWRLLDDSGRELRSGALARPEAEAAARGRVELPTLGIGWYRIEFGTRERPDLGWTTAAVLARLQAPTPLDSPVCVDSATAWFARGDVAKQRDFASLAALAGVNWVRDRLRWADIQPAPGAFVAGETTYDTAAEVQHAAGLKVLQVFHDTPSWARESADAGGRFAPDLRRAYELGRGLAGRFRGRVQAWEPWNEANIAAFGGHTVDQMCAWQKAAWLGFKAGDPSVIVGWNVTAAVPTAEHTTGVLANRAWPYLDTYNIHSYDWAHAYADLWGPAREAAAGRPLWVTEADRGTPHLKVGPWFDQDARLERRKAEWIAQAYASSLFAGARRHFHFILGHYHEPNGIQFGLLRLDLTPRPAYVALAAVGRCLAGAHPLGRWRPAPDVHVYAFRARPDGEACDVLVVWAEKEAEWEGRGRATSNWRLPRSLRVQRTLDYLGRTLDPGLPDPLRSAPVFVFLPEGQAAMLPLEAPRHPLGAPAKETPSPVVMQVTLPRSAQVRVEDRPWSEGYAYGLPGGQTNVVPIHLYNFGQSPARVLPRTADAPTGWRFTLPDEPIEIAPQERIKLAAVLEIHPSSEVRDGWIRVEADGDAMGRSHLAFRVRVRGE